MPYIDTAARERLRRNDARPQTVGELNYVITCHARDLVNNGDVWFLGSAIDIEVAKYLLDKPESYTVYNGVVGALESAAREWQRRRGIAGVNEAVFGMLRSAADQFYNNLVAPYEDTKIQTNGDVF